MSQKKIKRVRRAVNKQTDKIKIAGLREFVKHIQDMNHKDRIVFGINIILNRVRMR
jgi:hypothetical protein